MSEAIRPIRCWHGRVEEQRCTEPAVYEVGSLVPGLYCEEHAKIRLEEDLDERWVQFGEKQYLHWVEEAVDFVHKEFEKFWGRNPALVEVLEEADYLLKIELKRARQAFVAVGGRPWSTQAEVNRAMGQMKLLGGKQEEI
jgi:hypothetical protein